MEASVRRDVLVKADPARAFQAFTDINDLLAWFADGAVVGRRVGGNWGLGWYADEESDEGYHVFGTFEVYEPGSRLVVRDLRFSTPEGESWDGMRLSVGFEAENGGTRVTVAFSPKAPVGDLLSRLPPLPGEPRAWCAELR